jgi:UDP-glucose 4-epimerase
MKKNILVTGGSGHLGNFVCPFLMENGYNVTSFDIAPQKPDSKNGKAGIPFVMGNITSLGDCMRAITVSQADIIVHLAAIPFNTELQPPYKRVYNPKLTDGIRFQQMLPEHAAFEVNTMGAYFIMDAARRLGVKKVIAASSFFVLGNGFRISETPYVPEYLPMDEESPLLPEDTYSLSKVLCEEIYMTFSRAYGIGVVAMRLMGVYYHDSEFANPAHFGITVPPADDENKGYLGGNTYQYVDARDVSEFVRLAVEAENLKPFEAFFVATDTRYKEPTVEAVKRRWPSLIEKAKDIPGTEGLISIKKAERLLGYKSAYSWRNKKE